MTPQMEILTKSLAMSEVYKSKGKKYLTNDVNPFYKKTLKDVVENIKYAKECYKKVYLRFANTWFEREGKLPPREWKVFVF